MIGRRNPTQKRAAATEKRRVQAIDIEQENSRKWFLDSQPYDPKDKTKHVFAIGGEVGASEIQGDYVFAISLLVVKHAIHNSNGKLLLYGNMFLGNAAYRLGRSTTGGMFEIFPIELLDDKELLDSVFHLWDPKRTGDEDNLYSTFRDSLATARLLLR